MAELTISEAGRKVGLQSSAIRYYEQIGLLPRAERVSGQRRYDATAVHRLAMIQWARRLGFTLDEIRQLFFGFRNVTRASERWKALSQKKLEELDELMQAIETVRGLLTRLTTNCSCETLDQCGKRIFAKRGAEIALNPRLARGRKPVRTF